MPNTSDPAQYIAAQYQQLLEPGEHIVREGPLQLDSLNGMAFIFNLEEDLGIEIDNNILGEVKTYQELEKALVEIISHE